VERKKILLIVGVVVFVVALIGVSVFLNNQNSGVELDKVANSGGQSETDKVIQVTSENFESEVLNSEIPVLIDFYADWCVPCRILSSTLKEIANENENVKVVKIDVDNENGLATDYQIMSMPTLVVIKNGEEVNRIVGVQSKEQILSMLQ